jgi:hypothetical protein
MVNDFLLLLNPVFALCTDPSLPVTCVDQRQLAQIVKCIALFLLPGNIAFLDVQELSFPLKTTASGYRISISVEL